MWCMVRCPWTWVYHPVMKQHRLGVQTGFWQNVLRNETPSFRTRASKFGVTAAGSPTWPR